MRETFRALRRLLPHQRRYYEDRLFRRVSERRMERFLRDLGVREGMLVYVQSSFGSLGYYPRGAAGFLELLGRLLGPTGTVAMPSFPFDGAMEEFVRSRPVFDITNTPSRVGLLPEVLRRFPDAQRSLHPTHPVIARGGRAAELVEGHERCTTPQGPGSPFEKLVRWGAHILRIGTPAFPVCHHLQEVVEYPNLFLPGSVALECIDHDGRTVTVETRVYRKRVPFVFFMDAAQPGRSVPMNIIDFPVLLAGREHRLRTDPACRAPTDWLVGVRERFLANGQLIVRPLNDCVCDLFPLQPVFSFAVSEMNAMLERHKARYELSSLVAGLENGTIDV